MNLLIVLEVDIPDSGSLLASAALRNNSSIPLGGDRKLAGFDGYTTRAHVVPFQAGILGVAVTEDTIHLVVLRLGPFVLHPFILAFWRVERLLGLYLKAVDRVRGHRLWLYSSDALDLLILLLFLTGQFYARPPLVFLHGVPLIFPAHVACRVKASRKAQRLLGLSCLRLIVKRLLVCQYSLLFLWGPRPRRENLALDGQWHRSLCAGVCWGVMLLKIGAVPLLERATGSTLIVLLDKDLVGEAIRSDLGDRVLGARVSHLANREPALLLSVLSQN